MPGQRIVSGWRLFIQLWWTWIGFVILYNRHGEDRTSQRLLVLAGTLPCAVAAIEAHAAAGGQPLAFAFALAGARLILAVGFSRTTGPARRVAIGYAFSTAGFVASAFVPSPWRYVLWAFLLIQEAGLLLLRYGERGDGERARGRGGEHEGQRERPARRSRTEAVLAMFKPPADPASRVDAAHLSEHFGLMMMILLGEVVVAVAGSAAGVPVHGWRYWLGLLAGLVLAAALWWIYFTAAAPISEYVLRASGGNPAMAYGLYAGGHLVADDRTSKEIGRILLISPRTVEMHVRSSLRKLGCVTRAGAVWRLAGLDELPGSVRKRC